MRILLLVNDSYFSFLLAKPLIDRYHSSVVLAVLSTRVRSSIDKIRQIRRKSSLNYFLYRSFVQLLSLAVGTFGKKAVGSQISRYPISVLKLPNVNSSRSEISAFGPFDLGIALNFDQVIGEELLALCRYGILNTHASKLPNDKGISPAVWAFARGDNEIWTTIYKMDRGIDTGPVIHQFKISVLREDTVFSLYKRVCKEAGRELPNIVEKVVGNRAVFMDQEPKGAEAQLHWPNRHHSDMMRLNHRRYLKLTDLLDL